MTYFYYNIQYITILTLAPAIQPVKINVINFSHWLIVSLGPVYEFVCISFRTDNLNCFRAS